MRQHVATVALLGGLVLGVAAPAQEAPAQAGDPQGQRLIGEAPVPGSDGQQRDGARDKDVPGPASDVSADGVTLLQEAAAAGDPRAQRLLGRALLWGWPVPADPARGHALLQAAADAGDVAAMRILGEALVGGWVLPREAAAGRALLERAIAAGDHEAEVALGKLLLYGTGLDSDPAAARRLFEAAAASGNGAGLEVYGGWLMWGRRDPAGAEDMLRRAAGLGQGSAWTTLAEGAMYGYLGRGSRARFDGYAELARSAGEDRIAVLEAERRMWGISMRANGPAAVAILEQAVEGGNGVALRALVGLMRDGNGLNVRRDRARARATLERHADLLPPDEVTQLALSLDAAAAHRRDFAALAEAVAAQGERMSDRFARELHAANPNFAIYLLQTRLRREGLYSGALDGMATRATIRAMLRACERLDDRSGCDDSVMRPDVIAALMTR